MRALRWPSRIAIAVCVFAGCGDGRAADATSSAESDGTSLTDDVTSPRSDDLTAAVDIGDEAAVDADIDSALDALHSSDVWNEDSAIEPDIVATTFAVTSMSPLSVSARGGETLTLKGTGFAIAGNPPATVSVRGRTSTVLTETPDGLTVRVPTLLAGPANVVVAMSGFGSLTVSPALTVLPIALDFAEAPEDSSDATLGGDIADAEAIDVDQDGDIDLVVATSDGVRILRNDGFGHLKRLEVPSPIEDPLPIVPGGRGPVSALVRLDADGDGTDDLALCTSGARELLFATSPMGLVEKPGAFPRRSGRCLAMTELDLNRDGLADLAILEDASESGSGPRGLRVYVGDGQGHFVPASAVTPQNPALLTLGVASSADMAAVNELVRSTSAVADGTAGAELRFELTEGGPEARFVLPLSTDSGAGAATLAAAADFGAIELWLRGDGTPVTLQLRLVGSIASLLSPPLSPPAGDFALVTTPSLPTWTPEAGPGGIVPATSSLAEIGVMTALELVVRPAGAEPPVFPLKGSLGLDAVVTKGEGLMDFLLDDFERRPSRYSWDGARSLKAGHFDDDEVSDLVILRGTVAALAMSTLAPPSGDDGPYALMGLPTSVTQPWSDVEVIDVDGDGDEDLVGVGAEQDRVLLSDGFGKWLDVTLGGMPIDWVNGRCIAAGDLDLDGRLDVVIGNGPMVTDRLYLGLADGRFEDATPELGFDADDTAVVVAADLDGDDVLDVLTLSPDQNRPPRIRISTGGD